MASQSEQLEREAEETRWKVSLTLDELRGRMTPGEIVDQAIDYARDGPIAVFFRSLGREVRENPMPLVLIGIGIAWLMVASSRSSRAAIASAADSVDRAAVSVAKATDAAVGKASEWGQKTAARMTDLTGAGRRRTAELTDQARGLAEDLAAKDRAETAIAGAAARAAEPVWEHR